jgi:hypothetical protein
MLRALGLLLCLFVWAGGAEACPGGPTASDPLHLLAGRLRTPVTAEVRAGGTVPLALCDGLPGTGNIPFDPSVSILYVADGKRMDLEMRTEGECDTVILVRTPSGRWFFDDDNGAARNARIRLAAPREGRYEIWVGSQEGRACATRLALQTFRSVVRLALVPGAGRI